MVSWLAGGWVENWVAATDGETVEMRVDAMAGQ